MKLGKRFREGEQIPRGTWTISYWPTGGCSILNDVSAAYEHTYKLLDFEIPPKPFEPEVGKWYLVRTRNGSGIYLRQCVKGRSPGSLAMTDLGGDIRGFPRDYEFLSEWAEVER